METDVENQQNCINSIMDWSQNNGPAELAAEEQQAEIYADEKSARGVAVFKPVEVAIEETPFQSDVDEKSAMIHTEENSVGENTDNKASSLNAEEIKSETIAAIPLVIQAYSESTNQTYEPTLNGNDDIHSFNGSGLTNIDNDSQNVPSFMEESGNQVSGAINECDDISKEQLENEINQVDVENVKADLIVKNEIEEDKDVRDDAIEKVEEVVKEVGVKIESEGRTLKTESAGGMSMMIIWAKDDDQEEVTDSEQEDDNSSEIEQDNDSHSDIDQNNDNNSEFDQNNDDNSDIDQNNGNRSDVTEDNDSNSEVDDQDETNNYDEDQDDQCGDSESLPGIYFF